MTNDYLYCDRRAIVLWLSLCALLVASMVVIGGYTRLSGSGLSITEWQPIHGTIPPLNAEQWQEEFAAYQQSPQYKQVNRGMTLSEFKVIFWPEFIHRLLGRMIGMVFFIPLVIFALRRSFTRRFGWRLAGIFALGGLQGLIGWLMVKSGLVNVPQVSAYRLALHLSTALAILALILWAVMDVVTGYGLHVTGSASTLVTRNSQLVTYRLWFTLLCLQLVLGALTAGTHAGFIYNTWPTMNGHILPESWDKLTIIQFLHRNIAILVAFGFLFWWYCNRNHVKNAGLGKVCALIAAIIGVQFTLGVLTLINVVPLPLALAHQGGGLALFVASVVLLHKVMSHGSWVMSLKTNDPGLMANEH